MNEIINQKLAEILEKGGELSWKGKYFLIFEENWNVNPDLEWSGYTLGKMTLPDSFVPIARSMRVGELLDTFLEIIDTDMQEKIINDK